MDRTEKREVLIRGSWKNFLENYSEEYIEKIIDAFIDTTETDVNTENIVGEIIELPNKNGIIIVRHDNKTIGSVSFINDVIYVGIYGTEEAQFN